MTQYLQCILKYHTVLHVILQGRTFEVRMNTFDIMHVFHCVIKMVTRGNKIYVGQSFHSGFLLLEKTHAASSVYYHYHSVSSVSCGSLLVTRWHH